MLVVLCTFLSPKQITPKLPFLSGAMLPVSCWLSLQTSPFNLATVTVILNIPLLNTPGRETWLSHSHNWPISSSTNLTVSSSPFCCSQECAKATVDAVSTDFSILTPMLVLGKTILFVWLAVLSVWIVHCMLRTAPVSDWIGYMWSKPDFPPEASLCP